MHPPDLTGEVWIVTRHSERVAFRTGLAEVSDLAAMLGVADASDRRLALRDCAGPRRLRESRRSICDASALPSVADTARYIGPVAAIAAARFRGTVKS
jgi:hypothetical protein